LICPNVPSVTPPQNVNQHQFLNFAGAAPQNSLTRDLAAYIINKYANSSYSKTRLQKLGTIEIKWNEKSRGAVTARLHIDTVTEQLRKDRRFDANAFNIYPLKSNDLDSTVDIGLPQPLMGSDGKAVKFHLPVFPNTKFPISPLLDREGGVANVLMNVVQNNILDLTRLLVTSSAQSCSSMGSSWFNSFRMLLNEVVSSVDITLHMVWFLAKYRGTNLGWKFDEAALGPRHGVRLKDKFSWIHKITGRPLDNAPTEIRHFISLKDLRNHLNHFDPPCFGYTMDEMAQWLNKVRHVGVLHWRIREKLGFQLSNSIVEMVLLPNIEFSPKPGSERRPPNDGPVGYASCQWPPAANP
jgi:hypothetical protein